MKKPTHEIDAYLDGEPTPDQARALETWIQADRANAKTFLAAIRLHQQIGTQLRKDRFDLALRATNQTATTKDGDAAIQALFELASLDAGIPQSPVNFAAWREEKANKAAADQRKIRLTRTLIGGAVAAALLLAATLLAAVFTSDAPETPIAEQQANEQDATNPTTPAIPTRSVATLTATHNAQWAQASSAPGSLTPGSKLHPGTRLTLTAGFAEITTVEGAIAILEAPATIELLDHNNALRLHAGKLVGICETESSKGFLVRTPHMDVIDLGTEFGVEVTHRELTTTVFTGEVELITPDGASLLLIANQTAHLSGDDSNPTPIVAEGHIAMGFTRQMPNLFDSAILAIDFNSATSPTQRGFVGQSRLDQTHETRLGAIRVAVANQTKSDESWDRYPLTKLKGTSADLYRDFIFQNNAGESLTLTLSGEGVKPNSAYRLTFYSHDSLGGGRASTIRPSDGTTGPTIGPLGAGASPVTLDQYAGTGTFVADASGKLTFSIGNADGGSCLNGLSMAPNTDWTD